LLRPLGLAFALSLLALPFVPAAAADSAVTCQIVLQDWSETIHCGTTSTAVDSHEDWCPGASLADFLCGYFDILACTGPILFPCTIL
jgi:hypothetical protein